VHNAALTFFPFIRVNRTESFQVADDNLSLEMAGFLFVYVPVRS
jgi:hypothetical protein